MFTLEGMLKIMNSIDDCLNVSEKVVEETKETIPVVNKKEFGASRILCVF